MRTTIKVLVAAFAVTIAGAAPAFACGYSPCGTTYEPVYTYVPAYTYTPAYTGCGSCGTATVGYSYERLAEPTRQYYYVNQGPTYTGPGAFAPEPAYQEDAIPAYTHHYRPYGYHYGFRHYGWGHRYGYRYGYTPHHYGYASHQYGYRYGHEGHYWGHPLVRRYY
jgi:hypothetical protein